MKFWPIKKSIEFVRKIFPIMLLIVIFAFIFAFGIFVFDKIFFQSDSGYINNAIGAFMGAFFAFLFIRISEAFTKIYERENRHYNALVRLEHICNGYLNIISDNIFVIDDFIDIAQKAVQNDKRFIYFDVLHEFSIDKEITLDLANIELINEVFSLEVGVKKMNYSINATNRFYTDIKNAFIQKNIDFETYKINVNKLIEKLIQLKSFLTDLEKEDKRVLAISRILMKSKPIFIHFIHLVVSKKDFKKIEHKIDKEIEKIESKIEINKKIL